MHIPTASEPRRETSHDHLRSPSSDELLRSLVQRLVNSGVLKIQAEESTGEEIVLDTLLDGDRYLLIRVPPSKQSPVNLSPREQEIVRMVAQGHPNKIIADVLSISSWTVCTHLRRIFAKLGVGSRAAMVARLLEHGGTRGPTHLCNEPSRGRTESSSSTRNVTPTQETNAESRISRRDYLPRRAG
jgi:DNA-binding CsgD family transcriptional regulator